MASSNSTNAVVTKKRHPIRTLGIVIAAALIIIIAVVIIVVVTPHHHKSHASAFSRMYSQGGQVDGQLDYFSGLYGVHVNADYQIDKVYSITQLNQLTKSQLAGDVIILSHDNGVLTKEFHINSTVLVDGAPKTVSVGFSIDDQSSFQDPYAAYNKVASKDALRLLKQEGDLGAVLLGITAKKINDALVTGTVGQPAISYTGTGTLVKSNDIAAAYNDGIDPSYFAVGCDNPAKFGAPCGTNKAVYNFGCQTVGVSITDWKSFTNHIRAIAGVSTLVVNNLTPSNVVLQTSEPCGIIQNDGPAQLPTLPDAPTNPGTGQG